MNSISSKHIPTVPSIAELQGEIRPQIVRARHYKSGKIDKVGKIVGVVEYPSETVPFEHQTHHYDSEGRVLLLEKFVKEFSKPSLRFYRYEEWHVNEAIWADRYGNIENYHRYLYDDLTALMIWRAEYTYEGKLFYYIRSEYDSTRRLLQESWFDAEDKLVKRLLYEYDAAGELASESEHDRSDLQVGSRRFKYDKQGNLTERAWFNKEKKRMSRFLYTYDAKNQLVRVELRGVQDQLEARQEFTHDRIGNVIAEKWFDATGQLVKNLCFDGIADDISNSKAL
ncbi:MAG: hypothetical protein HY692_00380 [Cyanobacteria bacterium NC_groundwater_1444_Ag_S-0.65um_54_12]|nr:hypothetical protein [Cyanobacteria bacterium NC_groundwater_1444_Ag_S-0.65um_54_12]